MKKMTPALPALVLLLCLAGPAAAHFGMLIPSDSMVMPGEKTTVSVTLSFSHPMEMIGMDLAKPRAFGVLSPGGMQHLRGSLAEATVLGRRGWISQYRITRPGAYVFFMEPEPYWESAEDSFIVHYTKTVVGALGADRGWDAELGLKTEIVPLSRPFGLYAGNVFQGIVKVNGKPVPFAEVEVEHYNLGRKVTPPSDYMITQRLKADQNGVFTYAVPHAGWWGFAALSTAEDTLPHEGQAKPVEIGAVIWIRFHAWQER